MHAFTRSRVAIVIFSLSLLTFLWTFGLPRQLPTPALPNIHHDSAPQKGAPAPSTSSVAFASELGEVTGKQSLSTNAPTPSATQTPVDASDEKGEQAVSEDEGGHDPDLAPKPSAFPLTNHTAVANTTLCRNVQAASDVMVIVKTSAAEMYQKLPAHLLTLLSCAPNFAVFSDHEGTISGHPVYNALGDISNATREAHEEFKEYEKIQEQKISNETHPDSVTKELDKWKILPMVYKAYKLRPHQRFYIFIEADTSLSWMNLLLWTRRLDYRIPYYSGAPTFLGDVRFAQRGSGILLSNGALKQYAKSYDENYESEWEQRVAKECCGDMVLATALTDAHVEFYSAFPLLQGETPSTLDWTDKHWCAPVVSWHHMSAVDIDSLWEFQHKWTTERGWNTPYLFRNAFEEYISPLLAERSDMWDNLSQDVQIVKPANDSPMNFEENIEWYRFEEAIKNATKSVEKCRSICERADDCLQWKFKKEECVLGKVIRLGHRVHSKKDEGAWVSGWMVARINKAIGSWGECEEPAWKFNQ